ncbi:MAG: hypothetical protein KF886_09590 [Candidatus Hydrogenedentes bacterium]|nr:hypothetical protein [Candidatus Hydrogenedentota bacterium]
MSDAGDYPKPNEVRTILCLANSRKLSGRCIAGREILNGRPGLWIRPVSNREHQEVSLEERRYEDGRDPKVFDVIRIPLIEPCPHEYQQENWLLDPGFYWRKTDKLDWTELQDFVEPNSPLWLNHHSSYNGCNDRIPLEQATGLRSSLRLIHLERLTIQVFCPGAAFGNPKRRVQGRFHYAGDTYHLWITDPVYETQYLGKPDGTHEIGECCLTISLGEPYDGFVYKLIATVIKRM